MEWLALAVEAVAVALTFGGTAYGVLAWLGAREFARLPPAEAASERAPGVSILKPLKGIDPRMYVGLVSHCAQEYAGEYEVLFGVSSLEDAAVALIARLRVEYPERSLRLVVCPQRLGANGKVSNLAQMLPEARFEHVVVNDSDIVVSPRYLGQVMAAFGGGTKTQIPFGNDNQKDNGKGNSASDGKGNREGNSASVGEGNSGSEAEGAGKLVGLVTAPYVGIAGNTLWSRLEALGVATDFMAGVLTARKLEGGLRFGLGSTLATTKTALATIGGFEALVNELADDYELGARLARAGWRVQLVHEVVATAVPAYTLRGFCEHQLRWARSTRDSRHAGYLGMGVTYVLPWALAAVVASGGALWSFSLLSVALLVRVAVALQVGVGVLRDGQVLRDLWLLPLRDSFGLFFWAWSYAGDTIVWRGEQFRLENGRLQRAGDR